MPLPAMPSIRLLSVPEMCERVLQPASLTKTRGHRGKPEAVRMSGLRVRMCEYPIWFWNQWPWVSFPLEPKHETIKGSLRILRSGFGWSLLKEFRDGVSVDQCFPQNSRPSSSTAPK
jgi:hypothetical protein